MRQYYVYRMEYEADETEYIAVKDGFSFPAFFLGIIWFLKKRLWKYSLALLGFWLLEYIGLFVYWYWFLFFVMLAQMISGTFDPKQFASSEHILGIFALFKKLLSFTAYLLAFGSGAFIGVEANGFLRKKLVDDGYELIGIYEGSRRRAIKEATKI